MVFSRLARENGLCYENLYILYTGRINCRYKRKTAMPLYIQKEQIASTTKRPWHTKSRNILIGLRLSPLYCAKEPPRRYKNESAKESEKTVFSRLGQENVSFTTIYTLDIQNEQIVNKNRPCHAKIPRAYCLN
jgi:hypothetical protein